MIVPGIYLPLQKKAFHLDRSQRYERRVLILQFGQNDDSSIVQIMANRFSYKNWLYADTLIHVAQLTNMNTCLRIDITTYKSTSHGFIPVLKLVPFGCTGSEGYLYANRVLTYNLRDGKMTGTDKKIYRKGGFHALFRKPFIPASPIIKLSDIVVELK
jgi:hypothetical protein